MGQLVVDAADARLGAQEAAVDEVGERRLVDAGTSSKISPSSRLRRRPLWLISPVSHSLRSADRCRAREVLDLAAVEVADDALEARPCRRGRCSVISTDRRRRRRLRGQDRPLDVLADDLQLRRVDRAA